MKDRPRDCPQVLMGEDLPETEVGGIGVADQPFLMLQMMIRAVCVLVLLQVHTEYKALVLASLVLPRSVVAGLIHS